jgi:NADH-quinone oxidoreductase subunit J
MIDLLVFFVLGTLAIAFSVLVVEHRSLVYGAVALGFLGMVNAALFALVGFTFIALFHLAVYVGAGVVFILFSVTMFRGVPTVELRAKGLAVAVAALVALSLAVIFWSYSIVPVDPEQISYLHLSRVFTQNYWFPLLVTAIALVTTLIEGITLARREVS